MAGFFARRKYRSDVIGRLHAMLLFYPGGVRRIERDYPNLRNAIDINCDAGDVHPAFSATIVAGSILADKLLNLESRDRLVILQQLSQVDLANFKEVMAGRAEMPTDLMGATSLVALAFVMAEISRKNGEITDSELKSFTSEVLGALQGKDADQRSSERIRDILDDTIGPPPLTAGEDDTSEVYPSAGWNGELGQLNGTECKVGIVYSAIGYALVSKEDGGEITDRRSLTQADLEQVPRENWEECRFVNLHARDGEIVSCLIHGPESEVVGSKRAFWWALAKVVVKMTDVKAGGSRMSVHGLAYVHNAARGMWDTVVERARSIEELREEPVYMRSIHLDVISKMVDEAQTEAEKLGLEICKAMVLAVQSEDDKLEAAAYQRFKRYLWRKGEEPREFYAHETFAPAE